MVNQRERKREIRLVIDWYMGSNTFVDGVRRLFQRRSSSSSSSLVVTHNSTDNNHNNRNQSNGKNTHLAVNDSEPKSTTIIEKEEEELKIVEDFDLSGLNLIKVPKRISLVMDPHKKVPSLTPFLVFHTSRSAYIIAVLYFWSNTQMGRVKFQSF